MPANRYRLVRAHADFHFNKPLKAFNGHTRATIQAILSSNPCVDLQARKVARLELWREKTRYAFAISPHGHGLDCHRTWESLALGNIVIVKETAAEQLLPFTAPARIARAWRVAQKAGGHGRAAAMGSHRLANAESHQQPPR